MIVIVQGTGRGDNLRQIKEKEAARLLVWSCAIGIYRRCGKMASCHGRRYFRLKRLLGDGLAMTWWKSLNGPITKTPSDDLRWHSTSKTREAFGCEPLRGIPMDAMRASCQKA